MQLPSAWPSASLPSLPCLLYYWCSLCAKQSLPGGGSTAPAGWGCLQPRLQPRFMQRRQLTGRQQRSHHSPATGRHRWQFPPPARPRRPGHLAGQPAARVAPAWLTAKLAPAQQGLLKPPHGHNLWQSQANQQLGAQLLRLLLSQIPRQVCPTRGCQWLPSHTRASRL